METKIKNSLFIVLVFLLMLPAIQHKFRWYKERKLEGHFDPPVKPALSWENWIKGDYQQQQEKYVNQVVGFRPGFVRLHHEVDFRLFNLIHGNSVVQGNDGFLFEESYIHSALGQDFIGQDSVIYKTHLLRILQEKLKENGVQLVFVFAPGKGLIYPEKIPETYKKEKQSLTNYQAFVSEFEREGIHFIDFQAYVASKNKKARYPLMCKTGIHWSRYMECLAGDSIFSYLKSTWNFDFPKAKVEQVHSFNRAFGADEDIEQSLNLLSNLNDFPNMAYPKLAFNRDRKKTDPQLLVVGDSFYWGIFNTYGYHLNNPTFWYYFKEKHPATGQPIDPSTLNLKEELLKRKVVLLLFTDSNLKSFGYGFVEAAIKALSKK